MVGEKWRESVRHHIGGAACNLARTNSAHVTEESVHQRETMSREASKKAAKELLAMCEKEGVKVPTVCAAPASEVG
jgi:pyruvate kinase